MFLNLLIRQEVFLFSCREALKNFALPVHVESRFPIPNAIAKRLEPEATVLHPGWRYRAQ